MTRCFTLGWWRFRRRASSASCSTAGPGASRNSTAAFGVVYAVFLSLGFALWENIRYVLAYGFGTAIARALTAVPGHACFGVFMGAWYGAAKREALSGKRQKSRWLRFLAFLVPCLLHGAYDFIATTRLLEYGWLFLPFVAGLFLVSVGLVRHLSRGDRYI